MKTKDFSNIWKTTLVPFCPSNYAPGESINIFKFDIYVIKLKLQTSTYKLYLCGVEDKPSQT